MRIVAGRLGGRTFASPRSQRTHPMSDKVRGALFNTLGDIHGLTVLDAFAGSGALGFEAVSRGASSALMLENDRPAQQAIANNTAALGLQSSAKLVKANCSSWSDNNQQQSFDIVILDPPFDHLQPLAQAKMAKHVRNGGLYVLHLPASASPPSDLAIDGKSFMCLSQKNYGDSQLLFYRAGSLLEGDLSVA